MYHCNIWLMYNRVWRYNICSSWNNSNAHVCALIEIQLLKELKGTNSFWQFLFFLPCKIVHIFITAYEHTNYLCLLYSIFRFAYILYSNSALWINHTYLCILYTCSCALFYFRKINNLSLVHLYGISTWTWSPLLQRSDSQDEIIIIAISIGKMNK